MTLLFFLKSHFGPAHAWEEKKKKKITKRTLRRIVRVLPIAAGLSIAEMTAKFRKNEELALKLEQEFKKLKYEKEIEELILLGIL